MWLLARDNKEVVPRHTQFAVRNEQELCKLSEWFPLLEVVYCCPFLVRIFCPKTLEEGIKRLDPHLLLVRFSIIHICIHLSIGFVELTNLGDSK